VWWDVAPAEVSDDRDTVAARETYEQGRQAQRYYG
jgi:TPP-dependent trihydroxycyclohexane-1,2-dione (THcHDO) dehydratase